MERLLTKSIAKELMREPVDDVLEIDDFTDIELAAAEVLSAFCGEEASFDGLERVSCEAMEQLIGMRRAYLSFDGLTELPDEVAELLANHEGPGLSLRGLTELSPSAAHSLSQHDGELFLRIPHLSDDAVAALVNHQGSLLLQDLCELTPTAAKHLASYVGSLDEWGLLIDLEKLSGPSAEAFRDHRNKVEPVITYLLEESEIGSGGLGGLTELNLESAELLASSDLFLNLSGLKSLDDEIAQALANHQGSLALGNVREMTPEAAHHLSKHCGPLFVELTNFDGKVRDVLSSRKGISIDQKPVWGPYSSYDAFTLGFDEFVSLFQPCHLAGVQRSALRQFRRRAERYSEWPAEDLERISSFIKQIKSAKSIDDIVALLDQVRRAGGRDYGFDLPEIELELLQCLSHVVLPVEPFAVAIYRHVRRRELDVPIGVPVLMFSFEDCFELRMTDAGKAMARALERTAITPVTSKRDDD